MIELFSHQHDFVTDVEHRYLCMHAGYGAGKTFAFCMKAIYLASLNIGYKGMLCEPTNDLVVQILIPAMEEALEIAGVPYTLRRSPLPEFNLHFQSGDTKILLRSGENYTRLIGVNLAFAGVDELDTIDQNVARMMWKRLQGRMRSGNVYQLFTTSTPEGYRFMYEFFIKDPAKEPEKRGDRRTIHASTFDNTTLPQSFIDDLTRNYTIEERRAYLGGEFVNLAIGRVYYKHDRYLNNSTLTVDDLIKNATQKMDIYGKMHLMLPPLHIGMDFNVGKMTAVVHHIDETGPIAIDEITDVLDTPAIIEVIKKRYPDFRIHVYPDSSGKARDTAKASTSDIQLLTAAGFSTSAPEKNPPIRDRVTSMNVAFCNDKDVRKYRINAAKCPSFTTALEQQTRDDDGKPIKTNDWDHPNDAAGYFIHYKFPVRAYSPGRLKLAGVY